MQIDLFPIRSRIHVFPVRRVQTHRRDHRPRLHPHPRLHAHDPVLIKRHPNLSDAPVPHAIAAVAGVLAEAQKGPLLAAAAADAVSGQGAVGPASAPAVAVVVARVDGVQARGVEEGLHEGDGFGAGVRVALLG